MTNTDSTERPLRFQVYYSGGPGTEPERYLCSEWKTRDAAEGYVQANQSTHAQFEIVDTWHARYVIAVGHYGVSLYSENARGQWDATGLGGPFTTVIEAAEHQRTLPNSQTNIEVVSRLSPALWLGASANQMPSWHSCDKAALDVRFQHVDAYALAQQEREVA